jgi:hypothetical protein
MRMSILEWDIERTKAKGDGYGEIRDEKVYRAEDDEGEEEDDEEVPEKREW